MELEFGIEKRWMANKIPVVPFQYHKEITGAAEHTARGWVGGHKHIL